MLFADCHRLQTPPQLTLLTGSALLLRALLLLVTGGLTPAVELFNFTLAEMDTVIGPNGCLTNDTYHLDLVLRTWTRLDVVAPWLKRMFHDVAVAGLSIYLFGGLTRTHLLFVPVGDLWRLDTDSQIWECVFQQGDPGYTAADAAKVVPRYGHRMEFLPSLGIIGRPLHQGVFVAGGRDVMGTILNDVLIWDIQDQCWVAQLELKEHELLLRGLMGQNSASTPPNGAQLMPVPLFVKTAAVISHTPSLLAVFRKATQSLGPFLVFLLARHPHLTAPHLADPTRPHIPTAVLVGTPMGPPSEDGPLYLGFPMVSTFGPHIVVCGFLHNELDLSVFFFHPKAGQWLRLNLMCRHEYGNHRFWGGFVWALHHQVTVFGSTETVASSLSVRRYTHMILVPLPVLNMLHGLLTGDKTLKAPEPRKEDSPTAEDRLRAQLHDPMADFSAYAAYVTPDLLFTPLRLVLPQSAVALGADAFDRYGELLSDFELVANDGLRIPVPAVLARRRWGNCFDALLAALYAQQLIKLEERFQPPPSAVPSRQVLVDPPTFRLPFQERPAAQPYDPASLPPQPPLPQHLPPVLVSRDTSPVDPHEVAPRRLLIIDSLSALRRGSSVSSPGASPRLSVSAQGGIPLLRYRNSILLGYSVASPWRRGLVGEPPRGLSVSVETTPDPPLVLALRLIALPPGSTPFEPLACPRLIYVPHDPVVVKALVEFLYTGHVLLRWQLWPTTLKVMGVAHRLDIPLLYDLVVEVLYYVLGRAEGDMRLERRRAEMVYATLCTRTGHSSRYRRSSRSDYVVDNGWLDFYLLRKEGKVPEESADVDNDATGDLSASEVTLAELSAPDAALPPKSMIDLIHQHAGYANDLKLLGRTGHLRRLIKSHEVDMAELARLSADERAQLVPEAPVLPGTQRRATQVSPPQDDLVSIASAVSKRSTTTFAPSMVSGSSKSRRFGWLKGRKTLTE